MSQLNTRNASRRTAAVAAAAYMREIRTSYAFVVYDAGAAEISFDAAGLCLRSRELGTPISSARYNVFSYVCSYCFAFVLIYSCVSKTSNVGIPTKPTKMMRYPTFFGFIGISSLPFNSE
ncbi:hypothetical protein Trydic_g5283 [Trypoxylus dichotomus]